MQDSFHPQKKKKNNQEIGRRGKLEKRIAEKNEKDSLDQV